MTLANPFWLLLLLLVPAMIWHHRQRGVARQVSLRMPVLEAFAGATDWQTRLREWLPVFRWVSVGLIAVAMARPQRVWEEQKIKADAVDILLSMDISPSMLTKDFEPDRLAVSKNVAVEFVEKRQHDRLGLVAFSAEAFTQCPLTTDRRVVQEFIKNLQIGKLEDGTAIGMGLATAVNRLKDSPSRSRIVILLTDGENNAGYIQPLDAADIAATLGVKVYTIGIGTDGMALAPASRDPYTGQYSFAYRETHLETELLEQIAAKTGGKFYRAFEAKELEAIYADIDKLEKTEIEVTTVPRTTEFFHWFAGLAVALLCLEALLRWAVLRTVTQ